MSHSDRHPQAMRLYARAMAVVEPIRIKAWSEADLTTSQLRLLFALREEPGATLGALAEHLRVTPPTASGLVDRLVRQDYVRREEDAQDRRLVRNHLTARGLAVVAELEREGRALLEAILGRLSDAELDAVIRGLELFVEAAERAGAEPGVAAR